MIQTENSCDGADRVLSWLNLASACREQHRRLLAAREELAEVWPPESNASARVFMRQLDLLAASLDQTLTRAEETRVGLQGVFDALGAAQSTIRPLVAERVVVSDDLVPRFLDHAEDEYDERARQAMREAEAAIAEHGTQIQAPALFRLGSDEDESRLELPGQPPGSGPGGGPADGALRAVPRPVEVPHDPPAPSADPARSPGPGPELAGVVPGQPPAGGGRPPARGGAGFRGGPARNGDRRRCRRRPRPRPSAEPRRAGRRRGASGARACPGVPARHGGDRRPARAGHCPPAR
nr:hypothetical protein GCM10020092_051200 [Actinoplanes digitatis]